MIDSPFPAYQTPVSRSHHIKPVSPSFAIAGRYTSLFVAPLVVTQATRTCVPKMKSSSILSVFSSFEWHHNSG
jgi:hypothetical protein